MPNPRSDLPDRWTILSLLRWTTAYFERHEVESPRSSAEVLLASTLSANRIDLYAQYDKPLVDEELARFKSLIRRRAAGEPVAYILGEKEFWSLTLTVTPDVLIPRPETECLVEEALKRLAPFPGARVLELGVGTGAVTLAMARENDAARFTASDISLSAVRVAKTNADRLGEAGRIGFLVGDWLSPFAESGPAFDMIVSNPPYIPSGHIRSLQPEVAKFEPATALDGGPDGLDAIRNILRDAPRFLRPEGWLLLEIGCDQAEIVGEIAGGTGDYGKIDIRKDYAGRDRIVILRRRAT